MRPLSVEHLLTIVSKDAELTKAVKKALTSGCVPTEEQMDKLDRMLVEAGFFDCEEFEHFSMLRALDETDAPVN